MSPELPTADIAVQDFYGLSEQSGAAVWLQSRRLTNHRGIPGILPVAESVCPAFSGSGRMPVFQSIFDVGLSRKYHLKAVGCEKCAEQASDISTEQQWHELATQWHSMADQAAKMPDEFSPGEPAWIADNGRPASSKGRGPLGRAGFDPAVESLVNPADS
jgi:hypothetical protein